MYSLCFFFFNDPATTEIYTLSLHDALPILAKVRGVNVGIIGLGNVGSGAVEILAGNFEQIRDRKSTRLNSSHANISYAVFCLKKKKKKIKNTALKKATNMRTTVETCMHAKQ